MAPVSRGFRGRRASADPARVPPGQYVTPDFPVLSAGPTPHTPLEEWSFIIRGAADESVSWTWKDVTRREITCVDLRGLAGLEPAPNALPRED